MKMSVHVRLHSFLQLTEYVKPNISSIRASDQGRFLQVREGIRVGQSVTATRAMVAGASRALPSATASPFITFLAIPALYAHSFPLRQVSGTVIRVSQLRMVHRTRAFACTSAKCGFEFVVPIEIECVGVRRGL